MSKQTAVQLLKESIDRELKLGTKMVVNWDMYLAMEKEQMEQADINGYDRKQYQHDTQYGGAEYWDVEPKDFEQYYNETYRK